MAETSAETLAAAVEELKKSWRRLIKNAMEPNKKTGSVIRCGLCGSLGLRLILDLGLQPLAEQMREDSQMAPLRLVRCIDCDLVQLDYIVEPSQVFTPEHPYSSGNSKALHAHFELMAQELSDGLAVEALVVDIGCNDGTLLSKFSRLLRRVGVDPTNQIGRAKGMDSLYQTFFSAAVAEEIREQHGPASVVVATNVLAHVLDPHDFLRGVKTLLGDDGVFVTENHSVDAVLAGQWDTVYHEHLRYYSPDTLENLLRLNGLQVDRITSVDTHGGSFRMWATKRDTLQLQAERTRTLLQALLLEIHGRDEGIYGIGATTRASGLIHFVGIDNDLMPVVCEVSTSDKIGKVMPGTQIGVVSEDVLVEDQPEYALLFSWHLAADIMPKLRAKGYAGKFIIPLPEPKIVSA